MLRHAHDVYKHLSKQVAQRKPADLGWPLHMLTSRAQSDNGDEQQTQQLYPCIISAFSAYSAHRMSDGSYVTVQGSLNLHLHSSCAVYNDPPPPPGVTGIQ